MKTERVFVNFFVLLCCIIGGYGQQPQATFVTEAGSVSEADGSVEVCVNVSNANNIPSEGAEIKVFVLEGQGTNPVTFGDDYRPEQQFLNFTNETNSTQCVYFELIQDNLVEVTESMLVRIQSTDGQITTNPLLDIITFSVEDSDNITLGFSQILYTTQENVSVFNLCTQLEKGQIANGVQPIMVAFTVTAVTATLNDDYMMPLGDFVFDSNSIVNSSQCVEFTIVNDNIIEANETFSVLLRDVSSVTFSESVTTIMIIDDDFATVALNQSQLIVNEGNDTMNTTLSFSVEIIDEKDGIDREIIINIKTFEISATGLNDFIPLNESITFPDNAREGDSISFQILVIGDNFVETNEVFTVNISSFFPDVIGDPSSATVTIIHDGDSICPPLQDPSNGNVEVTNNTIGSTATYSCFNGYMLKGPQQRNCTADVGWSGQEPLCLRICGGLTIENGYVDDGLAVQGVVANYSCNDGFTLVGSSSRVCQSNGQWSGNAPVCQDLTEIPSTTTQIPPNNGSSNSRSVGIGVGVAVAIIIIVLVVVSVLIVLLLIKINRGKKRYIVNDTSENEYSTNNKVIISEIPVPPSPDKTVPENGELHELKESNGTSTMSPEIGEPLGTDC